MRRTIRIGLAFLSLSLTAAPALAAKIEWGPQQTIALGTLGMGSQALAVSAADVDGDGDVDVLAATNGDDRVAWFENTNGLGDFGSRRTITTVANGAASVVAADLDGDGDLDVLSSSIFDDEIAWYENDPNDAGSAGTFGAQRIISTLADGAISAVAADVDGDGDLDVLSASLFDNEIAWYENDPNDAGAAGTFGAQQVISTGADGARSVFAADLDGDGDPDVLSASQDDDRIAWYENTDGLGGFGVQQTITTTADGARSVFAADLDGDGDLDVLSASSNDNRIAWYENDPNDTGVAAFGAPQTINAFADAATSVFAADLDGDGDTDVLSASFDDDQIVWYENQNSLGAFGLKNIISTNADGPMSVFAADLDGDGDLDALSASWNDHRIAWYEHEALAIPTLGHWGLAVLAGLLWYAAGRYSM